MVSKKKVEKYLNLTEKALRKIKIKIPSNVNLKKVAEDYLDLAKRYFSDAKYFKSKGELTNAFTAVVYAHAFLDAGARLGVFDVEDSELFMV